MVAAQAGISAETAMADLKEPDFVGLKQQLEPGWLGAPGQPGKFAAVLKDTADFLVEQRSIRCGPRLKAFGKALKPASCNRRWREPRLAGMSDFVRFDGVSVRYGEGADGARPRACRTSASAAAISSASSVLPAAARPR